MPVSFSIKNVPDDVAEKLRQRAQRNHRSLQGELMTILQDAVAVEQNRGKLSVDQIVARVKNLDLPRYNEAAQMIREDRDNR